MRTVGYIDIQFKDEKKLNLLINLSQNLLEKINCLTF